ncbi:MAG TPA: tetratricopeptide repeat protein, partial [Hyphomicrobiaceae bacterium]|nr:tetratricopeptide repeat protein [Hyphomicrobiaceae bacterium]
SETASAANPSRMTDALLPAVAAGDHRAVVTTLAPLLSEVTRIGGSNAQREVVEDTYLIALMKSGDAEAARALLDARLHRRPSGRDSRWRMALAH